MSITFSPELFMEDSNEFMDELVCVNVSNQNARYLLENLGQEFDYCGDVTAEQFLGAILLAQAVAPADEGVPAHSALDNERFIDCGRRPGYLQELLLELTKVAEQAKELGRLVQWG